ncbi:hypothetical protein HDR66_02015 [bacterium]|nr:hypothetical protein [bacterium]
MKKYLLFLFLVGCGFRPMFSGTDTDIYVAPISGINGIDLRNSLNAKFGGQHNAGAKYTLSVRLSDPQLQYRALERTGDASWQQVSLTADFVLTHGDDQIATGHEVASESYTFVRYLVAANAAQNNAVRNIINVLADKISIRAITSTTDYEREHADK